MKIWILWCNDEYYSYEQIPHSYHQTKRSALKCMIKMRYLLAQEHRDDYLRSGWIHDSFDFRYWIEEINVLNLK